MQRNFALHAPPNMQQKHPVLPKSRSRMIRPGNFFPLLPATARYLRIDWSMQKNRPHDPASTTARSDPNDRTIQPQRPHDSAQRLQTSAKVVRRLFPLPSSSSAGKEKRLRAFLKTFRALRENISANETKRFGVFRRPGDGFSLRRQRTACRPPASSSFPDHAGSFQEKGNGQNCHFVHQYDIFSVVIR